MKSFSIFLFFLVSLFSNWSLTAQTFAQTVKMVATDRGYNDRFGQSVAMNGNRIIIGAKHEDHDVQGLNFVSNSGSAYIWELSHAGEWEEVQKLTAPVRSVNEHFGTSVDIYGNLAFVLSEDSTYVFKRGPFGNWDFDQSIAQGIPYSQIAPIVSFNVSGNYISASENFLFIGRHIYKKDSNNDWIFSQTMTDSDSSAYIANCVLDSTAIVGYKQEDWPFGPTNAMAGAGRAVIYELDNTGTWNMTQSLTAPVRAGYDWFGSAVGLTEDYAIIGAMYEDQNENETDSIYNSGSAYIFEKDASGNWVFHQKLSSPEREYAGKFGIGVAISGDIAIVGANWESDSSSVGPYFYQEAGATYVYKRDNLGNWNMNQKLIALDQLGYDWYGQALAIDNNKIVVAAKQQDLDENSVNPVVQGGATYLYLSCPEPDTDTVSICPGESYEFGSIEITEGGDYSEVFYGPEGCDSAVFLHVYMDYFDTTLIYSGSQLQINQPGLSYQWIDCSNNSIVSGETGQFFTPGSNGSYAAIITQNGCSDTTACFTVNNVGLFENENNPEYTLFPIPAGNSLFLETSEIKDCFNIEISSIGGKTILSQEYKDTNMIELNIEDLSPGTYFIRIEENRKTSIIQWIKK
jgi:hypothetical protein